MAARACRRVPGSPLLPVRPQAKGALGAYWRAMERNGATQRDVSPDAAKRLLDARLLAENSFPVTHRD